MRRIELLKTNSKATLDKLQLYCASIDQLFATTTVKQYYLNIFQRFINNSKHITV